MNVNTLIFIVVVLLGLAISRRGASLRERIAAIVVLAVVLLAAPQYSDNIDVLTPVFIALLMGAGWNIIGGYCGYASFGQVAFFGAGAYAMAATISRSNGFLAQPAGVGFLVAIGVCGLFAFVVGLPILRLRGHYFAISTLAFAIATQQTIRSMGFLGGTRGIPMPIIHEVYGIDWHTFFYYLGLGLAALSIVVTWLVARSKFGYGLQAIRENEDAAASMGVDTTRYKLQAFVLAAAITAVAGALQAYYHAIVTPENDSVFQVRNNLLPLIIPLIGGVGTVWGPLIGSFTYLGIEHVLTSASGSSTLVLNWEQVITGAIIVIVVLFLPRGLSQLVGARSLSWRIFVDNLQANRV